MTDRDRFKPCRAGCGWELTVDGAPGMCGGQAPYGTYDDPIGFDEHIHDGCGSLANWTDGERFECAECRQVVWQP